MDLASISHRARRSYLKKIKRKLVRKKIAQEREIKEAQELAELQNSPSYIKKQEKIVELQILEEEERKKQEQKWLEREKEAQLKWVEDQKKKLLAKQKANEVQQRIRDEWNRIQQDEQNKNNPNKINQQQHQQQNETNCLDENSSNLPPWHLPPPPVSSSSSTFKSLSNLTETSSSSQSSNSLLTRSILQTKSLTNENLVLNTRETCSFFRKTGACRFDFMCSRLHNYPISYDGTSSLLDFDEQIEKDNFDNPIDYSCIVLKFTKMFTHYYLSGLNLNKNSNAPEDQDSGLEIDETQLISDYFDFYHDVRSELESKWGKIAALRTCRNQADHLCGAVYVEFARGPSATWDAWEACNGRWYGGRQLNCTVVRLGGGWREAVCGLYHRGKCSKGDLNCNFLHVFLNPGETITDLNKALWNQLGQLPSLSVTTHPDHEQYISGNRYHHSHSTSVRYENNKKRKRRASSSSSSSSPSSLLFSSSTSRSTKSDHSKTHRKSHSHRHHGHNQGPDCYHDRDYHHHHHHHHKKSDKYESGHRNRHTTSGDSKQLSPSPNYHNHKHKSKSIDQQNPVSKSKSNTHSTSKHHDEQKMSHRNRDRDHHNFGFDTVKRREGRSKY